MENTRDAQESLKKRKKKEQKKRLEEEAESRWSKVVIDGSLNGADVAL